MIDQEKAREFQSVETDGDTINLDDFDQFLEAELGEHEADWASLRQNLHSLQDPDNLGDTILNVIWEQFMLQMEDSVVSEFINENNGLSLDLRTNSHIQTTENFSEGKIASHNTVIDYQKRYNNWQACFERDGSGQIITHEARSGKSENTLAKGVRKPFDEGRPSGSAERHTDMDHTISAAEIIRDPAANAHLERSEQIAFSNSGKNLNEIDSSLNRSKSDMSTTEWLDTPNARGQKPDEIFDISKSEELQLRQKDAEAREEYQAQIRKGEQRSIETGKQSQKAEFFRIQGKALRIAFLNLLAALVKEIIRKLILWLKSADRNLQTFLEHGKLAIQAFIRNLKELLIGVTDSVLTVIAASIIGPVVMTIKKAFILLKQGWLSLRKAVQFLLAPENSGKPVGELLPQVGIIIITGVSGIDAIVLGELIEKSLISIPFMAVDIPLLGSPANIVGTLAGGIVCGIIGAIAIDLINRHIAKQKASENLELQVDKGGEILVIQDQLIAVKHQKAKNAQEQVFQSIPEHHQKVKDQLLEIMERTSRPALSDGPSPEELTQLLSDL